MWAWASVVGFIAAALAVDLLVINRTPRELDLRQAAITSAVWVGIGLAFGLVVLAERGTQAAGEYYTVFLIEKSLSVDNLFVFALLFGYFAVPAAVQHRVLFWGVLGALVMRAVFITVGAALLARFAWAGFVFGGFMIYTAYRMWSPSEESVHPDQNPVLRLVRRVVPMSEAYDGARFTTRLADGRRLATPLLAVLVVVETTNVLFAVDSVPAALAVTRDVFVVFSANAFAMVGLRALYFVLAGALDRFHALPKGLAVIAAFIGIEFVVQPWVSVPTWVLLLVVTGVLLVSIVVSLARPRASPG
ncbi:MAG: TerC family protein [Acidimicrobiia bacterium]